MRRTKAWSSGGNALCAVEWLWPTDFAQFLREIGGVRRLPVFLRSPAAHAMPAHMRERAERMLAAQGDGGADG